MDQWACVDDGEGRGCGLGDPLRPRGVFPAGLVGEGELLGPLLDPEVDCLGARDPDERALGEGVRLAEDPGLAWPGLVGRAVADVVGVECGLNTLSGVLGPPNRLRPTSTRAPTRSRLPATPAALINLLRRPVGSEKIGPLSVRWSGGYTTV